METVSRLIEALYSRFLLVDVFGKIIPGFVVLYSAVMTFWSAPPALESVNQLGLWGWPVVFGLSWALGLGIQSLGQWVRLAHEFENLGTWYEQRARFQRIAQEAEVQQISRLLVIREASGNGCTALVTSLVIPALAKPYQVLSWFQENSWTRTVLIVLAGVIAYGFYRMSREHTRRCCEYVAAVLNAGSSSVAQPQHAAGGAGRAAADA